MQNGNFLLNAINQNPEARTALLNQAQEQIDYWQGVLKSLDENTEQKPTPSIAKAKAAKTSRKGPAKAKSPGRPKGASTKNGSFKYSTHTEAIAHVLGLKKFAEGGNTKELWPEVQKLIDAGSAKPMAKTVFHNTLQGMKKADQVEKTEGEAGSLWVLRKKEAANTENSASD